MKHLFICLLLSAFAQTSFAQTFHLSAELGEISGIEFLNDSTIVAINDGGNEPLLYLLNLKGKVQSVVKVENAQNRDWEDLTVDDEHLYIGDIGNNVNNRRDLVIYKVKITDVLEKKTVQPQKITFNYKEQTAFPPDRADKHFDAEALAFYNDSLYIFTKDRARPLKGSAYVYKIPTAAGDYTVSKSAEIFIGKGGLLTDALTAADFVDGEFFLMTYNRVIIKNLVDGEFVGEENINFKTYSQKEALVVKSKMELYVADEKQIMLGGPRMYRIEVNDLRDED
ncbi:MAG: hypothetical protein P8P74_16085 [Crocinitomicaceae bacterium]|nr:hypothetical protein [Crocinitomicaceae bacterium]